MRDNCIHHIQDFLKVIIFSTISWNYGKHNSVQGEFSDIKQHFIAI